MYHGIINVYKEAGYTSHDVVARLRGICKQKKIGHTGTLDPDAVGVLPVCLGNGTKLCALLTDKSKEYIAEFRLGITTDTQDISGRVLHTAEVQASVEEVEAAILSFQGEQQQVPPMYSAIKVNGKKLYELAREGKEVKREPRPITIEEIQILEQNHPQYKIRVTCSKGTYIRTLCHDIGQALGCGAVMTSLVRTRVDKFCVEEAYKLDELERLSGEGHLSEVIIPVEEMFSDLPGVSTKAETDIALHNGNQLHREMLFAKSQIPDGEDKAFRVYDSEGRFCGVYQHCPESGFLKPLKMFL